MFDIGGPQFGLRQAIIGLWEGDGTYSDVRRVPSVRVLEAQIETVTARLEGDDKITATAAIAIGGTLTLEMGSVHNSVISMISGGEYITQAGYNVTRISGATFPYVGIVGQSRAVEGSGDTLVFIPKAKCQDGFSFRYEYGAFSIPNITFAISVDDNYIGSDNNGTIVASIQHSTAITTLTLPPLEFA